MSESARTVLFVLGVLVASLGAAMLAPAIADLQDDSRAAHAFFVSALAALAVGGVMALSGRGSSNRLTARGAIILTGGSWAVLALVAAVPLKLALPWLSCKITNTMRRQKRSPPCSKRNPSASPMHWPRWTLRSRADRRKWRSRAWKRNCNSIRAICP